MKKIALFMAIVMLLSCGTIFSSCGENGGSSSFEDELSQALKSELMAKISLYDVMHGKSLVYSSHDVNIVTITEGETYEVSGTVSARQGGSKYSAEYSGEVEYSAETNKFDFDIEVEDFK